MNLQEITKDVLQEKYGSKPGETRDEIFARVAKHLASVEKDSARWESEFLAALNDGFIPAGRVMAAAGTGVTTTMMNCFVIPIGDTISGEDKSGLPGIYNSLGLAAESLRRGGGCGYDFSHIRPKGAWVNGTSSRASGPVSYARVFNTSCETVESAGARRGAQLGCLRVDHPDIEEFIHAKDKAGEMTNFNLSVGITDAFMAAVEANAPWRAEHSGVVREWKSASELWDQIMLSTYDHAEPGVLFIDTINRLNPLSGFEILETTNPCGEVPLPNFGCCCLGSIDLTRFVTNPFNYSQSGGAPFEYARFSKTVATAVRMLDNVLDLTYWPLPQQKAEAMAKRRIGLGFTGLGDALVMMGLRYDSNEACSFAAKLAQKMRDVAYKTSANLGMEKGVTDVCAKAGLNRRNSHLLSIAPTGTISLAFGDNCSNGIEPPFSWTYDRKKRLAEGGHRIYSVEDHAYRLYKHLFGKEPPLGTGPWVTALEISALDHMRMLEAVQPFVDSSISKTVNVPADYPYDDFKDLYMQAWKAGLKGLATYRPNAVLGSVLSVPTTEKKEEPKHAQPAHALRFDHRPRSSHGNPSHTYWVDHPAGNFSVTVGHLADDDRPFEVWVNGHGASPALGALAKSLSLDMRVEDPEWIARKLAQLLDYPEPNGSFWAPVPGKDKKRHYPSAIAYLAALCCHRLHVQGVLTADCKPVRADGVKHDEPAQTQAHKPCPECGAELTKRDGCEACASCGYIGACG